MTNCHDKAVLEPRVSPAFAITHFYNHCNNSPTPMVIHEGMWMQWLFFQNLTKRSMTPRWPLTPLLLRSHVLSKSHKNMSKYVARWPFFKNLNQRSLTLDGIWPHICWGHRFDSTQGSLCPSPTGIHECMWILWSILQNTTYILRTYYIHAH